MRRFIRLFIPPVFLVIARKAFGRKQKKAPPVTPNFLRIGSFSQQGEDLIIDQIIRKESDGLFVDVGAYDPKIFSNTNRFYLRGWSGINIEPQPARFQKFLTDRARDINLNCGIHHEATHLNFYQLEVETLSTFDKAQAEANAKRFHCEIENVYKVQVYSLKEIFKKYLKNGRRIDFMSIDTEGNEMNVLRGNDWINFRPTLVLIEFGDGAFDIDSFLRGVNYELVYANNTNGLYLNLEV